MRAKIAPLAEKFGIGVQELFNAHLSVDYYWMSEHGHEDGGRNVYIISPRVTGEKSGVVATGFGLGQCAFLKEGLCSVHALGKPFECAVVKGCADDVTGDVHHEIAAAWDKPEFQQIVLNLLERKFF